jgi:protein SCO1/2
VDALPPDLRTRVDVALTTVDPERDTDAVVVDYVHHFFEDGTALRTADPAALAAATKAFDVRFQVEAHQPGADYRVAHTAVTYVVDDQGTVVDEWPFGFTSENMAADLRTLLGTGAAA